MSWLSILVPEHITGVMKKRILNVLELVIITQSRISKLFKFTSTQLMKTLFIEYWVELNLETPRYYWSIDPASLMYVLNDVSILFGYKAKSGTFVFPPTCLLVLVFKNTLLNLSQKIQCICMLYKYDISTVTH